MLGYRFRDLSLTDSDSEVEDKLKQNEAVILQKPSISGESRVHLKRAVNVLATLQPEDMQNVSIESKDGQKKWKGPSTTPNDKSSNWF